MSFATATVIKSETSGPVDIQWFRCENGSYGVAILDRLNEANREVKVWEFDSIVAEPISWYWYDYTIRTTRQHQAQEESFMDIPAALMDAEVEDIEVMIRRMMMRVS